MTMRFFTKPAIAESESAKSDEPKSDEPKATEAAHCSVVVPTVYQACEIFRYRSVQSLFQQLECVPSAMTHGEKQPFMYLP